MTHPEKRTPGGNRANADDNKQSAAIVQPASICGKGLAVQQPFEFGEFGDSVLRPSTPVRFEAELIIVTIDGIEHQFDHPVGALLSKIVNGERFNVALLKREFYALQLFDFVNVFSRTKYVLGTLEFGRPPQELMAAKLNGMAMASRWRDARQRARFVRLFCEAIGRCGFVPAEAA